MWRITAEGCWLCSPSRFTSSGLVSASCHWRGAVVYYCTPRSLVNNPGLEALRGASKSPVEVEASFHFLINSGLFTELVPMICFHSLCRHGRRQSYATLKSAAFLFILYLWSLWHTDDNMPHADDHSSVLTNWSQWQRRFPPRSLFVLLVFTLCPDRLDRLRCRHSVCGTTHTCCSSTERETPFYQHPVPSVSICAFFLITIHIIQQSSSRAVLVSVELLSLSFCWDRGNHILWQTLYLLCIINISWDWNRNRLLCLSDHF